jgi:arsenate reductase
MKLYGIPNCSTVKKARAWLDEHGVAYEFHDYKKQGVDQATLDNWLAQMPWEKLVNRAGMTWRALTDAEKTAVTDNASAAALMQAKPSVIRRPIIVRDNRIVAVGFNAENYQALL